MSGCKLPGFDNHPRNLNAGGLLRSLTALAVFSGRQCCGVWKRGCRSRRWTQTPLHRSRSSTLWCQPTKVGLQLMPPSELRSCVKVEVAVLGSPSLIVRTVFVGCKATLNFNSSILARPFIQATDRRMVANVEDVNAALE